MRVSLLALLVFSGVASAQTGTLGAFSFLRLDLSPRAAALAGAFDAVPSDDPALVFYNPALLGDAAADQVSLLYQNHLSDVNAGALAYSRAVRGLHAAVGLRYLSWGELERATAEGERTGTFGAGGVALSAGASYAASARLRYGATVHVARFSIDDRAATALAADAAVAYVVPEERLTLSASVHNLGVALSSLGATRDDLPLDVRVAVSKRLRYLPLLLSVTGYNLHEPGAGQPDRSAGAQVLAHVILGGELQFSEAFQVRVGFNPRRNQELRTQDRLDFAGLGLGFGLKVRRVAFDYGTMSWSENGRLHHFGVRARL